MKFEEKAKEMRKKGVKIMPANEAILEQRVYDLEMEVANLKADIEALMGHRRERTDLEYAKQI